MYVEIFAKSDDNEGSSGKRSWLNTGDGGVSPELLFTKPTHLGSPSWHVELKARDWRQSGTGELGGEAPVTTYSLEVQLTPADVAALVNFALKNNLVQVVPGEARE